MNTVTQSIKPNKLLNLVSSLSNNLMVEIIDLDATQLPTKSGRSYIQFKCYYKLLDGSENQFEYIAAHFSDAGKLLMTLDIDSRYQITTETSERGYEEWVSAVKLPDDFTCEVKSPSKRIALLDPCDPNEAYDDPLDASEVVEDFVL